MERKKVVVLGFFSIFVLILGWNAAWAADWPRTVSIGTASVGGGFYVTGGAFVKIFEMMGVRATIEVSAGSLHNTRLLHTKQMLFAVIVNDIAKQGYMGTGWAKQKYDNVRSVLLLYPGFAHGWTLAKNNIKDFSDLQGRIVSGGPPGGYSDTQLKAVGDVLGIKFSRIVGVPYSDTVNLLRDGLIDAAYSSSTSAIPFPAPAEVTETLEGGMVFGFKADDVKKIQATYPYLLMTYLPANSFKNQPNPLPSFSEWTGFFAHKDIPDDMIYKFLEVVFANTKHLVATHISLKETTLENQKYFTFPLHPGAYQFYKGKGIPIPDQVLPPKQ